MVINYWEGGGGGGATKRGQKKRGGGSAMLKGERAQHMLRLKWELEVLAILMVGRKRSPPGVSTLLGFKGHHPFRDSNGRTIATLLSGFNVLYLYQRCTRGVYTQCIISLTLYKCVTDRGGFIQSQWSWRGANPTLEKDR